MRQSVHREPRAPFLRAAVSTAWLGGKPRRSQVVRRQARAFGNAREHSRPDFLAIVECKDDESCENTIDLRRRLVAHASAIEMG
jgi:hypothetical protein